MAQEIEFIKMHGTGNDFVVVDTRANGHRAWADLAAKLCNRNFGVGSDGLLLIDADENKGYRFRMFNPDGSEAEMCGNGIRCFAKYLYDTGEIGEGWLEVDTLAGLLKVNVHPGDNDNFNVSVDMGPPFLNPAEIPVQAETTPVKDMPLSVNGTNLAITAVSMGNPHAITFLDDIESFPLTTLGPEVEHHPAFPQRTNFEIAHVVGRDRINVRVWERGAGPTLACGTGACATAVAARLHGLTDETVTVGLPGGDLTISWDGEGRVLMRGAAQTVFSGTWLQGD
jgi:diaminopimelate epimerase